MIDSIPMTTLLTINPQAAVKAQRVQFAIDLLAQDRREVEIVRRIQACFHCSRWTARRTLDAAKDIAA